MSISGHETTSLFIPAAQSAQIQRSVSTFSICSAQALVRAGFMGGFSVLHTQSPFFQVLLKGYDVPSLSIRVPRFVTGFVPATSSCTCMVVIFKDLYY